MSGLRWQYGVPSNSDTIYNRSHSTFLTSHRVDPVSPVPEDEEPDQRSLRPSRTLYLGRIEPKLGGLKRVSKKPGRHLCRPTIGDCVSKNPDLRISPNLRCVLKSYRHSGGRFEKGPAPTQRKSKLDVGRAFEDPLLLREMYLWSVNHHHCPL